MNHNLRRLGWFILVCGGVIGTMIVVKGPQTPPKPPIQQQQQVQPPPPPIQPPPPAKPKVPAISTVMPKHLAYNQIPGQLQQWNKEAPDLTECGSYGKTSRGQAIHYIRVTNRLSQQPKKVVLIHACIHGNEPLATSTLMAWVGGMLSQYGKDQNITTMIDTRDIYFVPVLSPDSYPGSRHVDGVDPNRNFPCPGRPGVRSVPPIQSAQDFFKKIKPSAVISCHTSGRLCLIPWGDSMTNCPDYDSYKRVVGKVAQMNNYRFLRACDMYEEPHVSTEWSQPIYGGELDWYYRQRAMSVVFELGTHQSIPSLQDTKTEYDRTFRGMLHFIQEAPNVQLKVK